MLVSNPCAPDRRVLREAQALVTRGHVVIVFAWDREARFAPSETRQGVQIERVAAPAGYGSGIRRVGPWFAFAWQALLRLRRGRWDAVHCHDLDTLPVGFLATRRRRVPLVFDAHESYPDLAAPRLPGWGVTVLRWLERFLIRRVDALITVGELLAAHYRPWASQVAVVRNCPLPAKDPPDAEALRAGWELGDVRLVLCYIGGFTRGRVILPLIEAVRAEPDVGLVLVGHGPQGGRLLKAAAGVERITYLGERVPPDQVVTIMRACDVVYYGLRSDFANNRFSSPNALYSALQAGRPLLTTDVGEISRIVKTESCGIILGDATVKDIRMALHRFRDSHVRALMAQRARRAAEAKYNWPAAEAILLDVYDSLWRGA
jgi:glycosyltransferase involved in cell wall biosynthesis